MISYAQNFEDVILMRALKHVEKGVYVDIGAHDPVENSVSLAFYERGWRGVHVEPSPRAAESLRLARPDEMTIEAACTTRSGPIEISLVGDTGLTTGKPEFAQLHSQSGWKLENVKVATVTLENVLSQFEKSDVHWLKIDVEGMEGEVLESWGSSKVRPWIVAIESTIPFSPIENFQDWHGELESRGYVFVYFDGLNRFYVHESRKEICQSFGPGPNYFDDFSISETSPFAKYLNDLRRQAHDAHVDREREQRERHKEELRTLEDQIQLLSSDVKVLRDHIDRVNASIAWKFTAPLRVFTGPKSDPLDWRLSLSERLFFRMSGRPVYVVKRALFHKNGKPRGIFKNWVLDNNRKPRAAFKKWMESESYRCLPRAVFQSDFSQLLPLRLTGGGGKGRPKVAIVAPVSPQGAIGGAERFYNGLAGSLRNHGCFVDLIQVPFDESSIESIKAGYEAFEAMNLDEYDLVISTKAPSYCVRHRNHVLYLVHTIRVFYDMFETVFPDADSMILEARDWVQNRDTKAISSISRRYSIGETVSKRLRDFNKLDAEVIHPGLDIDVPRPTPAGNYFFMPGRLHRWKRVHLAIEAVKKSSLPISLRISGTGEHEEELRELAGKDERIIFEGYVDDDRLQRLYSRALGVLFCPINEDYGYVTLEAFAHGKPVITCSDSGEPLQFVTDGQTGFVVAPEADDIRIAMEKLWSDREAAQVMGTRAVGVAARISWSIVADRLVRNPSPLIQNMLTLGKSERLKVAVLDMQPITPPVGGGRLRLLGLYHDLGDAFDVRYVGAFDWRGEKERRKFATPSLEEIVISLSDAHYDAAEKAQRAAGGKVVIDMLFADQANLSPRYVSEALAAVAWADIVVFSHPWCAPVIPEEKLSGKLVVYDSHNMELDLRSRLLDPDDEFQGQVIKRVESAESLAGSRADLILACSQEDTLRFIKHYGWQPSVIDFVPNGVFVTDFPETDLALRNGARRRLGLTDTTVLAFFIGSNYLPNVEAAQSIIARLAPECPDIAFVIAGGVCDAILGELPHNVRAIGKISDDERRDWLLASEIAVNPIMSGSGTNIKMFDYAAAGLPIVSTATGARGIVDTSSYGITICEIDEMPHFLNELLADGQKRIDAGRQSRSFVEARFAWERLSRDLGRLFMAEFIRMKGRDTLERAQTETARVIHVSTVGHKCGIGEYTRQFIDHIDKKGLSSTIFTSRTPSTYPDLSGLGSPSAVAWLQDDVNYRDSALEKDFEELTVKSAADFAILQHHPGFLPELEVLKLADVFKNNKVQFAVVLHSYTEGQKELLQNLNRRGIPVFSHKKKDVLEAAEQGGTLFHVPLAVPHCAGILERIAPRNVDAPVIASNGFLREHKGIPALVEAFAILRKEIPAAQLKLLCPLYPSKDSEQAREQVEQAIARHSLEDCVDLDMTYYEKDELIAELAKADIAVYPYGKSAEGGSAAAADAISLGLPVVISPSGIFDDIRQVATTSTTEPRDISDSLLRILKNSAEYEKKASQTRAYAARNSWENVVETIFGTFK